MAVPDRPDPDDIIASTWGQWVHDHLKNAGPLIRTVPTVIGWPSSTAICDHVQIGHLVVGRVHVTASAAVATTGGLGLTGTGLPVPAVQSDMGMTGIAIISAGNVPVLTRINTDLSVNFFPTQNGTPYVIRNNTGLHPLTLGAGNACAAMICYLAAAAAA